MMTLPNAPSFTSGIRSEYPTATDHRNGNQPFHHAERIASRMRLVALTVMAICVSVGFCQPEVTQQEPSVANRLGTSQSAQYGSTTEVLGSSPMRAPPTSCTNMPGVDRVHSF